jgi:hypothetical protein
VEHRKADVRQVAGHNASGDDPARFLQELRQLRDGAGLGHAELAARAHYPYDSIRAAEVGPSLPDLPVLSAFVRGCGGTTEEWEERWRSLTRSPSLPVPAARTAGVSAAATAGARIGAVSQDSDNPDPSVIIAALNRVAEEMAAASPPAEPAETMPAAPAAVAEPTVPVTPVSPVPAVPAAPAAAAPAAPAATGPTGSDASAPADPLGGGHRAGWDPIRVSTAWPALPATADDRLATDAGAAGKRTSGRGAGARRGAAAARATAPASPADPASDVAAPWGTAPWASDPADAKPARTAASRPAATGRRAQAAAPARAQAAAVSGPARTATRARIVVVALVLLCALAVVLAIFV